MDIREERVNELLAGLKKQQLVFTHRQEICDAAVKASYLIGNEIAWASKPLSEGEFVKISKLQAFTNIILTRNTDADRISDLSVYLVSQLRRKVK